MVIALLESGFIKIYRSLLAWEWYDDRNTTDVFLHLLLTANYEPRKWQGMTVERGQRICSRGGIAKELHISEQSVRTALTHLKSTNELTIKTSCQGTVITVVNYDKYQSPTNEPTNDQPTPNQQPTNDQPVCKKANKAKKDKESNNKELCAFDELWAIYPKKQSRNEAMKSYSKLKPSAELQATIRNAVATAKTCEDWRKEGGRYVPMLSTWLNNKRWEDEAAKPQEPPEPQKMKMGELDEW